MQRHPAWAVPLAATLACAACPAAPAVAEEAPDPARLKADMARIAAFAAERGPVPAGGAPPQPDAARRWAAGELTRISDACGGCITSANIARTVATAHKPGGVEIVDILGFQQGIEPRRTIILAAPLRGSAQEGPAGTETAPGPAPDDGAGVAVVLEAARILSRQTFRATIVYALLSGDTQERYGSALLADTARQRHWTVSAVVANDGPGAIAGGDGPADTRRLRISFGGVSALRKAGAAPAAGGGDARPSHALAMAISGIADALFGGPAILLDGSDDDGDADAFAALGYPAVRLAAAGRLGGPEPAGAVEGDYLAKVAAINIAVARRLAAAPGAPTDATVAGRPGDEATLSWQPVAGAAGYRIRWRRDAACDWQAAIDLPASASVAPVTAEAGHVFGVAAIGPDGAESLATIARPR